MKKLLLSQRSNVLSVLIGMLVLAVVSGCGGQGSSSDGGSIPAVAGMQITIDNAGVIPVFGNSSTSTVVYVHNNGKTTVSGISYSAVVSNSSAKASLSSKLFSLFSSNKSLSSTVNGSQCSMIAAGQSCPLSITTPVLSGATTQGSLEIKASYSQNNKITTFTQLINYAQVQNNGQTSGAKFQAGVSISGNGNAVGYGTIYLYGSGQNQVYNVSSITINKPAITIVNGNISGKQIQSNFVQAVEISSPISDSSVSATITVNSSISSGSTSTKSSNKSLKSSNSLLAGDQFSKSVDITVEPANAGAILTTGFVPLINTVNVTSGSLLIRNAGNQIATIGVVSAGNGISNLSGCSNSSLPASATCTITFNVTESGGSTNITVPYTGGSASSIAANVTWFNGAILVSMSSSVNPISFPATENGSTTITVTNVGGYVLTNISIPAPIVISGSATATLGTNNCSGIDLAIGSSCEYVVNVADSQIELDRQINAGFSASYTGVSGSQSYSRLFPISYNSTTNGAILVLTPSTANIAISGNSVDLTTQALTLSNSGSLPATITSAGLSYNPAFLVESSTTCGASLASGASCVYALQLGPTWSPVESSGVSSYTVNYTTSGQTQSESVTSQVNWTLQGYAQSISLTGQTAFGHTSGNGESVGTQYEFTARGRDVVNKTITLTYTNTGTDAMKIAGIQDSNSVYTWQIGGSGTTCAAGTILQPNDTCDLVYTSVFESNILALGASVGTSYTENLIVPTLIYQDASNSAVQFQAQANLPTGGTTIYAHSNQATLANSVIIEYIGTADETVTISHLLANADDDLNVTVTTKMEDYFVAPVTPSDCSVSTENGIRTQTCIMGNADLSMSATYAVNPTLLNSVTNLVLTTLFSTDERSQIVSMNPTFATSNLGTIPLIYFASNNLNGYNGNLLAEAQSRAALPGQPAFDGTNGIEAADYLCNTDESKPALPSTATYRAMIVAAGLRQACSMYSYEPCTTADGNNIDWVMGQFINYVNTKGSIIGTTNGAGIFTFNTNNFIGILPQAGMTEVRAWTGLSDENWPLSDLTCNAWTSSSVNDLGVPGLVGVDLGGLQIAIDQMSCDTRKYEDNSVNGLYCVQQ